MEFIHVMNNTKWEELRLSMYELGSLKPRWRARTIENGHISNWDSEWFYHFKEGGYKNIEWVEIEITSKKQELAVYQILSKINVPSKRIDSGYKVYRHIPIGTTIDYL